MTLRRGRVLLAILGIDQHEAGALSAARLLRDAGMEVIYLGRFNTPAAVVAAAVAEDADVIGISTHSWEYLGYLDDLQLELVKAAAVIPIVVGGSVITPEDEVTLRERGVAACFGPGTTPGEIVEGVTKLLEASPQ
jgi:methylmalonyl-CoA mutase, C-terminal domain